MSSEVSQGAALALTDRSGSLSAVVVDVDTFMSNDCSVMLLVGICRCACCFCFSDV